MVGELVTVESVEEYNEALRRITLLYAENTSMGCEESQRLTQLIEDYEERHWPLFV